MAQINIVTLNKIEKQRNSVHGTVPSTYTVFEVYGKKYLQLDMYGKPKREKPEQISQSVQMDKEAARVIVELLSKEFNLQ